MSLCFTSMSFVLFHIIYQITVNSLLATHSINADFNCECLTLSRPVNSRLAHGQ